MARERDPLRLYFSGCQIRCHHVTPYPNNDEEPTNPQRHLGTRQMTTTVKRATLYLNAEDVAALDALRDHLRSTGKLPWCNQMQAMRFGLKEAARVVTANAPENAP